MKSRNQITRIITGAIIPQALLLASGISASAQLNLYNTGYSTSAAPLGTVDNLWQITAVTNLPSGYNLPETTPYSAFLVTSGEPAQYDNSVGPSGDASKWITFNNPIFDQTDTKGIITTYTLNFSAVAGSYQLNFEADNGVSVLLGVPGSQTLVYSDGAGASDYSTWHSVGLNITSPGNHQLNIDVLNTPGSEADNQTALRVDFTTTPAPEPSTFALAALGGMAFLVRRRNK